MSPSGSGKVRARGGFTLLELVIVIAIIAILVSLMLPVVMMMRSAAMRTACDNHRHQLTIGLSMYLDAVRPMFLAAPTDKAPTGWAFAVMPFIEESSLHDTFNFHQPVTSPDNIAAAGNRPTIYTCPVVPEIDSTLAGVGVSHYVLVIDNDERRPYEWRKRNWMFQDAAGGSKFPWVTSPEVPWKNRGYPQPHEGAASIFGF